MAPLLRSTGAMTLRVAFVGAGRMARQHLHALRRVKTPHLVVGVHDAHPGAARALGALAGVPAYDSLTDLLREARPQVVQVCTPPGAHFGPARAALEAGAHVYVEKPFVETAADAAALLVLARDRRKLVCAGHQLLRDPSFTRLMVHARALGPAVQVDSAFAFRPPGLSPETASPEALAAQLIDILPHPLYTLIEALERLAPGGGPVAVTSVDASPADLHALLTAGEVVGRLTISLRARPVASTLTVSGAGGTLTADFVRGVLIGAGNPGTEPLEKILNPLLEGSQLIVRTVRALARRFTSGGAYPGLAELIGDFYAAAASGRASPVAPRHLVRVTQISEELAGEVRASAARVRAARLAPPDVLPVAPVAVLTGARGFLGRELARELAARGFAVHGTSRTPDETQASVHAWVKADLSRRVPPEALAGAAVVVHAAAETAGSFAEHQANSVEATRNLLAAMHAGGVTSLVYVSSLSVLRPPSTPWERQDERTPLAPHARKLGAYAWGKCQAERVVLEEAGALGIRVCVVRPGALVDAQRPELPGLVGRRLFGDWHLGFGRPGLPFAVAEVRRAAAAIAWCAEHFEEAPPVVNLMDPDVATRRELLGRLRACGWRGRMVWVPIPLFAALVTAARWGLALVRLQRPAPLAVWSVLRPRRYDASLGARLLVAATAVREPRRSPYPLQEAGGDLSLAGEAAG